MVNTTDECNSQDNVNSSSPSELYAAISSDRWKDAIAITKKSSTEAKTWIFCQQKDEDSSKIEEEELPCFLPLHSACARKPPDVVVETLLLAYPEAAMCKDDNGMLPLHYACGNQASNIVINMLLIVYSEAVAVRDPSGKLPIHHLCRWGPSSNGTVNMLLSMYPESVHALDKNELRPLDLAWSGRYPGRGHIITSLQRCTIAFTISKLMVKHTSEHFDPRIEKRDEDEQDQTEISNKQKTRMGSSTHEMIIHEKRSNATELEKEIAIRMNRDETTQDSKSPSEQSDDENMDASELIFPKNIVTSHTETILEAVERSKSLENQPESKCEEVKIGFVHQKEQFIINQQGTILLPEFLCMVFGILTIVFSLYDSYS